MCDKTTGPVLTDYDITMNAIHQDNMFKGTITVCIIYAVFAFILIGLAYAFDNIRELLFDKFLPFTLIYIIGTITIIMIFIYFIVTFKPRKIEKKRVSENVSCPDYWKLEVLDDDVINKSFDVVNYNKNLFKYRCVMDDNIFDKGTIYSQDKQDYSSNLYRMGNISPYYTGHKGTDYTGVYDKNKFISIKNDVDNKALYLYKDVNSYNGLNLAYDGLKTSNIFDDLRNSAFIMNNYKAIFDKKDIKSYKNIFNDTYDGTANSELITKHKIYYGSPPILTWATPGATTTVGTSISANSSTEPTFNSTGIDAAIQYSATVYDWNNTKEKIINTFGKKMDIHVYIIDTSVQIADGNFIKVGTIKNEQNLDNKGNIVSEHLYFESEVNIRKHANLFTNNKTFYFPDTYLTTTNLSTLSSEDKNLTNSVLSDKSYIKGPKIRLFNNKERVIEISNTPTKDVPTSTIDQNTSTSTIPLTCSSVYPSLLESRETNYEFNNTLRCAYAKVCNIPWSDMNCNDIEPYAEDAQS
jgi:hypothetical protein